MTPLVSPSGPSAVLLRWNNFTNTVIIRKGKRGGGSVLFNLKVNLIKDIKFVLPQPQIPFPSSVVSSSHIVLCTVIRNV